jgi:TonB-dependent SusC/RagA subfamily outer membrane receptor
MYFWDTNLKYHNPMNPSKTIACIIATLALTTAYGQNESADTTSIKTVSVAGVDGPLYIVDGHECSNLDLVKSEDIVSIDVVKDPKVLSQYGVNGTKGVIIVKTKSCSAIDKNQKSAKECKNVR